MLQHNNPYRTGSSTRSPRWEGEYLQAIALLRQGAIDLNRLTFKRAPIPMERTHVRFMTSHRNLDLVTDGIDQLADNIGTLENLVGYHKLRTAKEDAEDLADAENHLRRATVRLTALANRRAKEARG